MGTGRRTRGAGLPHRPRPLRRRARPAGSRARRGPRVLRRVARGPGQEEAAAVPPKVQARPHGEGDGHEMRPQAGARRQPRLLGKGPEHGAVREPGLPGPGRLVPRLLLLPDAGAVLPGGRVPRGVPRAVPRGDARRAAPGVGGALRGQARREDADIGRAARVDRRLHELRYVSLAAVYVRVCVQPRGTDDRGFRP